MESKNPFGAPYGGEPSIPPEHYDTHSEPFSRRPSQQHFIDEYIHQHGHYDLNDFHQNHIAQEDLDDCEILKRPRLTREQVDVLENQFQSHSKPNSNVKRQLAIQTNLPLSRVSNWFQNRRAKAKQIKKQEEFELQQAMGQTESWEKDNIDTPALGHRSQLSSSSAASIKTPLVTVTKKRDDIPASTSLLTSPNFDTVQEASYASLQRALDAAVAGRVQFSQGPEDQFATFPPSDDSSINNPGVHAGNAGTRGISNSAVSDWGSSAASSGAWTPSQCSDDPYDFAGVSIPHQPSQDHSPHDVLAESLPQPVFNQSFAHFSFATNSSSFNEPLNQQPPPPSIQEQQAIYAPDSTLMSQPLQSPFYPESRRGSCSEELADSLGNFGLNPISQSTPVPPQSQDDAFKRPDTHIDIAARRKRPRPATLGTAALRSRSYGGPPTMSPTTRLTPTGPSSAVRRIKSTGQSLNVNYSGVRKVSSAQRSPLNIASFAEAGAFDRAMTNQAGVSHSHPSMPMSSTFAPLTPLSPNDGTNVHSDLYGNEYYLGVDQDTPHQFVPASISMNPNIASPPHTPLNLEMIAHMQYPWMAPPPFSAPPQYATFPDCTPPYSAGPLTSSSLSDAPLNSPEFHSFPPSIHMPQPTYISPMIYGEPDMYHPGMHTSPSQGPSPHAFQSGISPRSAPQKTTEFCIHEFPQQKEAHAAVAKQLAGGKPKNYIFANATSSDYQQDLV